ncbi:hypothetical protein BN439_2165 [Erwinia amylovora Ea644]|nr:hypothetical protein BN439_2165 [Erwinia amylovora Ea644]CCP07225.1 hypothetical protein BN440_2202 [Erwinia amylovora MR1]
MGIHTKFRLSQNPEPFRGDVQDIAGQFFPLIISSRPDSNAGK